ncbi:MAG: hypothetical protein ACR2PF_07045 [Rhizobiaceae bacterium]
MQYALFEDIKNRATIESRPAKSSVRVERVDVAIKPSAVMEAGLGGFGTAIGKSGNRYVFSKTTEEQAMLYDKALFAVGHVTAGSVSVSSDVLALWVDGVPRDADLFVHILELDQDCAAALQDLRHRP